MEMVGYICWGMVVVCTIVFFIDGNTRDPLGDPLDDWVIPRGGYTLPEPQKSQKEKVEFPIRFCCWKCRKVNFAVLKGEVESVEHDSDFMLDCKFCTSLYNGAEKATVNAVYAPLSGGGIPL